MTLREELELIQSLEHLKIISYEHRDGQPIVITLESDK